MKKISLVALFVISTAITFAQSEYHYKAKFEGADDATKAAPIIKAMKMVFKTDATYNESTSQLEFNSKMSISQTVFNNMMSGEGFAVESFERQEIKAAEIAPAKTETVETKSLSPEKKDAEIKTGNTAMQTQAVKKPK